MTITYTLDDLQKVSEQLLTLVPHKILLFYGEMGVGKTTLIKELVKQLGSKDIVSSPTFSLVNEYHSVQGEIMYHFDFYRINHENEAMDIGVDEYFERDSWCFIEWPEKVKNLLPLNAVELHLSINDDETRSISIK